MSVSRISTPTGIVPVTPVTRLPPLSVGDVIAVRVARHLSDNVMRLASGGFQLDVEGEEMLPVGSRALLKVDGETGRPKLSVSADPSGLAQPGAGPATTRISALAAGLAAGQDGLAPLYAGLSGLVQSTGPAGAKALPAALANAISTLFGLQLDAASLDGKALRRAAEGVSGGRLGGVLADLAKWLEAAAGGREPLPRQATPPPPPGLAARARGEPPGSPSAGLMVALSRRDGGEAAALLLAKALGALARQRFAGLASHGLVGEGAREGARGADHVILLPVAVPQGISILELRIGRDDTPGHEGEGAHPAFRVRFGLETPACGAVEGLVGLDGERLFATLKVEREEGRAALSRELEPLGAELRALGLEVMDLRILALEPTPPPTVAGAPASSGQLVDRVS
jgi:hypothetical protein